ncbi:hypothetical protein [Paracidovorax wautersii]|uniref:hypothetical protein n=1 Tax=Paracidovorax wautersii TaxID=1177982 RepID=UPI000B816504|nr:hypothetical protein [Paracidovorax wautersii]
MRLVFGDEGGGTTRPPVQLAGTGRITGLQGVVPLRVVSRIAATGSITGLRGHVEARYLVNVDRPVAGDVASSWQQGRKAFGGGLQGWQQGTRAHAAVAVLAQPAQPVQAMLQGRWQQSARWAQIARVADEQARRLAVPPAAQRLQQAVQLRTAVRGGFEQAAGLRVAALQPFQQAARLRAQALQRFERAGQLALLQVSGFRRGLPQGRGWQLAFEQGRKPPPGISAWQPVPPLPDPCYVPALPARLLFEMPAGSGASPVGLVFVCERHTGTAPQPQFVIPLLRVYMSVNTIDAVLLPSLERVQLQGISITADDDGFGWSMSARGPVHLLDQLAPSGGLPARVRVTINGIAWVFAIDPPERSRKFGDHGVQVRGASVTSLLGAPHMPASVWSNSSDMTAQQLALQALDMTGVSLDWAMQDWLVPAGAWSHQGSPLSVVQRIAEAAGGVVRSHCVDARLQIAPRYAVMPWDWASAVPTVRMPGQIITADTLQALGAARYDAVYVSGETGAGVLGHVVRAGSAGEVLAPQVTDALVTHVDAARQRGSAVIAAAAITHRHPITLPLLTGGTNPGLILPGYLIEVQEPAETWRGLVRGITITADMPTVRQQLAVERTSSAPKGLGAGSASSNLYKRLLDLQPEAPVQTGVVQSVNGAVARVQLTGTGVVSVRNPLQIAAGQSVFVQGGAITGTAPQLPVTRIEI